jgi:hypothetical protein
MASDLSKRNNFSAQSLEAGDGIAHQNVTSGSSHEKDDRDLRIRIEYVEGGESIRTITVN